MYDRNDIAYTSWSTGTTLPEGLAMLPDGSMVETSAQDSSIDDSELDVAGEYAVMWQGRLVGYERTERAALARYAQICKDGGIAE